MFKLNKIRRKILGRSLPCAILMYHHIQNDGVDPWETSVRLDYFREQLDVLKDDYDVLPLSAYDQAISRQPHKRRKVFITFDDGYLDNFQTAVPELKKRDFAATFFIPTKILYSSEYFWWEIVDHLFWGKERLPARLELSCEEQIFTRGLSPVVLESHPHTEEDWSANNEPPPTERCRLYLTLCNWIKERSPQEQQVIADQLMALCTHKEVAGARKMSAAQIKALSNQGFEIGAHTVHHPALGFQSFEIQRQEITKSKAQLEKLVDGPVTSIAYPHGHFNQDTVRITKDAGYSLACTTESGCVAVNADRFTLPRIWVKNTDGVTFRQGLVRLFKD